MKKKTILKELKALPIPRQGAVEHAIDMSNKASRLADKLELIGDNFITGEITRDQALVAYRAYGAAAKSVKVAHFARNQVAILPKE
jgi:hypothetical protein